MTNENSLDTASADSIDKELGIRKIYIKDLSLEIPAGPSVFRPDWKPETIVQVGSNAEDLSEGDWEVVLALTVTAKVAGTAAFQAEVQQAGLFTITGCSQQELQHLLGSYCPSTLFPFAREAVGNLIARAGFPPPNLAPINFDLLLAQSKGKTEKFGSILPVTSRVVAR